MNDLDLDKNYKKGIKGPKVKLIQEWLCLHGLHGQRQFARPWRSFGRSPRRPMLVQSEGNYGSDAVNSSRSR